MRPPVIEHMHPLLLHPMGDGTWYDVDITGQPYIAIMLAPDKTEPVKASVRKLQMDIADVHAMLHQIVLGLN